MKLEPAMNQPVRQSLIQRRCLNSLCFLLCVFFLAGCNPSADKTSSASTSKSQPPSAIDLQGQPVDPFKQGGNKGTVLLFVAHDCPISNRYAPELRRIHAQFAKQGIAFFLVYPVAETKTATIRQHVNEYNLPGTPIRDPNHVLVDKTGASVTPEAAVYDAQQEQVYLGRIDNWYEDFGQYRPEPTTHELVDALKAVVQGQKPSVRQAKAVGCYIP